MPAVEILSTETRPAREADPVGQTMLEKILSNHGENFGAGSSRQQAVDCFKDLGTTMMIAMIFGAIYERNAINAALPILRAGLVDADIQDGERIRVDLRTGQIMRLKTKETIPGVPFSDAQMRIYQRGRLLGHN